MRRKGIVFVTLLLAVLVTGMARHPAQDTVPRMSKEELKARLGAPDLVVIDVRVAKDWEGSDRKVAGAVREDPASPEKWAGMYSREKTLVLYCA